MVLVSATLIIVAQERSQRSEVEKRMRATSALALGYAHEQATGLGALVAAYGDRPTLRAALEARRGDTSSAAVIDALLDGLITSRPDVAFTFLTDARGVALAVQPPTPASIGKSFAFRDWYKGALSSRGPYISEAYQSQAAGRPFVVAASILVRSKPTAAGPGRPLGILAATYSLSSFQRFVEGYAARTGIALLIIDKRGVLIADGGHRSKPGASLEDRRAAARRALAAEGVLSAKTTDPGTGWTVISEVPTDAALGPAATFRGVVLLASGLLIALMVGGAGAVARIRHHRRIAEEEIRESEERAETERRRAREDVNRFFSLSLDLLCIASTDGYFKQINPAWQAVLGYDANELLEAPFASFVHPDDLEATAAEVEKLMDGAPTVAFENRYRCKDGSYRWLLWKAAPLPEAGLMYAVARDNTDRKRVEQSSARLAAIVDSSVDAIVGASLDGAITSWNRGAEQIFGYRPEEIVGRPIRVLAPLDDSEQADLLARAARGDVIAPYEASRRRKDGQLIEVAISKSPVREPDGTVIGISMIARDISESRRSAEALRAIISTASDGFVSMDAGGLITEWNHRAEALFGWPRGEAIGRELAALIIPESLREAHRTGLRRVLGGAGDESSVLDQLVEVSALHRDGHEFPVELAVWRVAAGPAEQFSAFVRDISARQQIARDVEAARDQAVEASRLKSEFLATMSHEIRTPMNGVIGLTGLLLNGELEGTARRYAEGIRSAGSALLAVISDILDFSKIEAGALELDDAAVNLSSLLDDVIALVSETARSKGLELQGFCDPDLPALVRGDPVRIRQILLNLAANAVKFTEHGQVMVSIRHVSPSSGHVADPAVDSDVVDVRFEVTDTGIGIEQANLDRLFDAFAQADASTTRRFGGTGLGLAICRELAEAMGGQVGVQSKPGEGSMFWCTIPLRCDSSGEQVRTDLDTGLASRPVPVGGNGDTSSIPAFQPLPVVPALGHLLLVEDNEINQMVAEGILAQLGYSVDVAGDGLQALELVAATTYRAVLMDCQMPNMDGYEAANELRRRESLAAELDDSSDARLVRLPIIAMTAAALKEDRDRCLAAGMDDYLTKPIQPDELAAALIRWTAEVSLDAANAAPAEPKSAEPTSTQTASVERAIANRLDDLRDIVPEGLVSRLVTSFLKRAPGYLAVLSDTLQAGDADAFANAAHSLKGVAANLGADTCADLCDELEACGLDDRLDSAPDLLDRLRVEYDAARRVFEDLAVLPGQAMPTG